MAEDGPDTRPASVHGADLISARYETAYRVEKDRDEEGSVVRVRHVPSGLRVRIRTTGPAAPSFGPTVGHELWITADGCDVVLRMYVRGPLSRPDEPPQRAELSAREEGCAGGTAIFTGGLSLSFRGSESILEHPRSRRSQRRPAACWVPGR